MQWALRLAVSTGVVILSGAIISSAQDATWNQFRGPRADGTSLATDLPTQFSEGSPEITWKIPVPGRAWASPVIGNGQIWLSNASPIQNLEDGQTRLEKPVLLSAVCLDLKTGQVLHDVQLFEVFSPQYTHPTNSYGSPTPFLEEGAVYFHFGVHGTACVNPETAEIVWKRSDLPCNHFRGAGSSPAVYGDLLYLTMDGFDEQYLIALNKKNGETVWRKDRDVDFGTLDGDHRKAYSTPTMIHVDGKDQLISSFAMATIAYEPLTGETIWTVRHGGVNAAARPLYGNGFVYLNSAEGPSPLLAVDPKGQGDLTETNIVWRSNKMIPKRSSQLLIDDLLFMVNDSSVVSCVDALTGKQLWAARLGGDYWSSPIYAHGLIYSCSQTGMVSVFKAAREFELVSQNQLESGFNASPAVVGNALVLRSMTHVYRIEKPTTAGRLGE